MDTYYHITTPSAWEKIQQEGLIPQLGERSKKVNEQSPAVFLFESRAAMEDAYFGWLGDEYEKETKLVILAVKPPKGLILDESVACAGEVRCYNSLLPECITFLGYDDEVID